MSVLASFRLMVKRFVLLFVGAALVFGMVQPAAVAVNPRDAVNVEKPLSASELSEKRAQRRAQQSQASKAADTEIEADSLGEVLNDKLNLEEIAEDNVIVDGPKDVTAPDGDRQRK